MNRGLESRLQLCRLHGQLGNTLSTDANKADSLIGLFSSMLIIADPEEAWKPSEISNGRHEDNTAKGLAFTVGERLGDDPLIDTSLMLQTVAVLVDFLGITFGVSRAEPTQFSESRRYGRSGSRSAGIRAESSGGYATFVG